MKRLLLTTLLVAIFAVPLCAAGATGETYIVLHELWHYRWGDSPVKEDGSLAWLSEETGWQAHRHGVNPPDRQSDYLWLRGQLPEYSIPDAALFINSIEENFTLYVEDKPVYSFGELVPGCTSFHGNTWHIIDLPPQSSGKTIFFRCYSHAPNIGINSDVVLASRASIYRYMILFDLDKILLAGGMLILSIISLIIGIHFAGRDRGYITLGVFILSMALFSFSRTNIKHLVVTLPMFWMYFDFIASVMIPSSLCIFFTIVFGPGRLQFCRILYSTHIFYGVSTLILALAGFINIFDARRWFIVLFILTAAYITLRALRLAFRRNTDARIFSIGLLMLTIISLYDALIGLGVVGWSRSYLHWGMLFFTITLASIMSRRIIRFYQSMKELSQRLTDAKDQLEDYAANLEEKVQERTSDLLEANERLESINGILVETNRELESARTTMDTDLKMATNVQRSFFQRDVPRVCGWEIAHTFMPMSGVSGDMFDFFVNDDNRLEGMTLMDVSGHGITSALITMMARTVISRRFADMKALPLNEVMEGINMVLNREMRGVYLYLTGILLRFHETRVEYVNAAHPDLFVIRRNGEIKPVVPDFQPWKGFFLGIPVADSRHYVHSFDIEQGDMLLVFSDCLIETRTTNSEIFGQDGVLNALHKCRRDTADALLTDLMNRFFAETASEVLRDDLTVIVLRKL